MQVLQCEEGNFLRAFVDYAFLTLNKELDFNAGFADIQQLALGIIDLIKKYTLFLKEIKNAERIQDIHLIENIVKLVNPYNVFLDIGKVETL